VLYHSSSVARGSGDSRQIAEKLLVRLKTNKKQTNKKKNQQTNKQSKLRIYKK
jgi:hypothetical protein